MNLLNLLTKNKFYICLLFAVVFASLWVYEYNKDKKVEVVTIEVVNNDTIKDAVPGVPSSTVDSITKKIEQTKPVASITTTTKMSDKDVKKEVASTVKDTTNIVRQEQNEHTTNIYAIDASKKFQHGLGIYTGYNKNVSSVTYGVHFRNKRLYIDAGCDTKRNYECKIGYELIQW